LIFTQTRNHFNFNETRWGPYPNRILTRVRPAYSQFWLRCHQGRLLLPGSTRSLPSISTHGRIFLTFFSNHAILCSQGVLHLSEVVRNASAYDTHRADVKPRNFFQSAKVVLIKRCCWMLTYQTLCSKLLTGYTCYKCVPNIHCSMPLMHPS